MLGVAIVAFAAHATHTTALAQSATALSAKSPSAVSVVAPLENLLSYKYYGGDDPVITTFDVKAASAADGAAGEYPLEYIINYDDGSEQTISIAGDGTTEYTTPAAANPVSITYQGNVIFFQWQTLWHWCAPANANGGCWCLCLQWQRFFGWWVRPRFFWYYNPCC
jgi:hypothetical protein